ncbi:MAG: GAF domain-containing protein [Proteobacteria bacterium]|nr:GAF domain-containing protein [Pseudomonadota bacterium]
MIRRFRADPTIWVPAVLAIALAVAGSVYLLREQWRNELSTAQDRTRADAEQLASRIAGELTAGRYEGLPALLEGWARTEPSIASLRLEAANGFVLAEFSRPELTGDHLTHSIGVNYGYRGEAHLRSVMDLGAAVARQRKLRSELALGNLVLAIGVVAAALLLGALRSSTRRYQMLLATNERLLGGPGERNLLQAVCEIAVRDGGYALAWIGLLENGPFMRPTAASGPALGYLEGLQLTADDSRVEGRGPAGEALRTGQPYVCNDFEADPRAAPWLERASAYGIRASIALPLRRGDGVIGVLSFYSRRPGRFDAAERALLEQMAADISLGIEYVHRGAELERSLAQLNEIESTARAGAFELALPARRLWCSVGAATLLGRAPGEQQVAATEVDGAGRDAAADLVEYVAAMATSAGSFDFDLPVGLHPAAPRWLRVSGEIALVPEGSATRGMVQDVSERKALEVEITRAADRERQRLASELHDNLGQVLTGASLMLGALERGAQGAPARPPDLTRASELVHESLRLCRTLAHEAAPILSAGLGASLEGLAVASSGGGVRCRASVSAGARNVEGEQALELFRIAQEAVTNALKHAQCRQIDISLTQRGPMLELAVRDDGIGFGTLAVSGRGGLGQRTMRYRAARAGGTIVFRNNGDRGASVIVRVRRLAA